MALKPLTLLVSGLLLTSGSFASGNAIEMNSCHVQFDNSVAISPDQLSFRNGDNEVYSIVNNQLFVAGNPVDLNSQQQTLVNTISTNLHQYPSQIQEIALQGINLGRHAMVMTSGLLGDKESFELIDNSLLKAETELKAHFKNQRTFVITPNGIEGLDDSIETAMDAAFGEDFEQAIEHAALKSMGKISWFALKAVLTGGESVEHDMEARAEKMEVALEADAEALEHKAEALCHNLEELDQAENALHLSIQSLKDFNLITLKERRAQRTVAL